VFDFPRVFGILLLDADSAGLKKTPRLWGFLLSMWWSHGESNPGQIDADSTGGTILTPFGYIDDSLVSFDSKIFLKSS